MQVDCGTKCQGPLGHSAREGLHPDVTDLISVQVEPLELWERGALDHLQVLYLGNNKFSQQSKDMLKTAMSKTNCSINF